MEMILIGIGKVIFLFLGIVFLVCILEEFRHVEEKDENDV